MIVEVEGGVHEEPWMLVRDRIRRRALQSMGYHMTSVKNAELRRPEETANRIIEEYYQTTELSRHVKVIQFHPHEMPIEKHYTDRRVKALAQLVAPSFSGETWTPDEPVRLLEGLEPGVTHSQSAMDRVLLMCFGLGLKLKALPSARLVDFEGTAKLFDRLTSLMTGLFGEAGAQGMQNLLNISAPNFFKNLVFSGGPKVNPAIVVVDSPESLRSQIAEFNASLGQAGVTVEESDVYLEIREACRKLQGRLPESLEWTTTLGK